MRKLICIAALALAFLLGGCTGQRDALPEPVTMTPDWTIQDPTEPIETSADPEIRVHLDNTQSTHGYAGKAGAMVKTLVEITDSACFDEGISTWILEPTEGSKVLEWQNRNPRFLQSALVRTEWDLYTINDEDFAKGSGGPISTVFGKEADPNTVMALVTDMLEQESCLESLTRYVSELFQANTHQQLRVYIANSAFDGRVSFPVIIGEHFAVRGSSFSGERPFAVIVAGPAAGVEKFHRIISGCGVEFTEFMVENQRQPTAVELAINASEVMQENIFVNEPADAKCSLDVEPITELDGCFAFRYHKYSAQKEPASRVSVLIEVDEGCELTVGYLAWWEWRQPEQAADAESLPEQTDSTASTESTVSPGCVWVPCASPADAVLEMKLLEPGTAISDRSAEESGVADITIPEGKWLYELSILMEGDDFAAKAYAVELALNTGLPANPLAAVEDFLVWDTSFASYGIVPDADKLLESADPNSPEAKTALSLKNETLSRIPDLELLLRALAAMDTRDTETQAAAVKIILQNYESNH